MSIRAIITEGFGSFGTIPDVVRQGFTASEAVLVVVDTHDGEDERDRDHKRKRDKLREQIRLAIDGPDAPLEIEDDPIVQQIIRPVIRTPERLGLDDYMRIHARLLARFDEIENSLREEEDEILLLH